MFAILVKTAEDIPYMCSEKPHVLQYVRGREDEGFYMNCDGHVCLTNEKERCTKFDSFYEAKEEINRIKATLTSFGKVYVKCIIIYLNDAKEDKGGNTMSNHAEKCPVCNGTGKIKEINPYAGTDAPLLEKTCHGCNGKGWVTVSDEQNIKINYGEIYE